MIRVTACPRQLRDILVLTRKTTKYPPQTDHPTEPEARAHARCRVYCTHISRASCRQRKPTNTGGEAQDPAAVSRGTGSESRPNAAHSRPKQAWLSRAGAGFPTWSSSTPASKRSLSHARLVARSMRQSERQVRSPGPVKLHERRPELRCACSQARSSPATCSATRASSPEPSKRSSRPAARDHRSLRPSPLLAASCSPKFRGTRAQRCRSRALRLACGASIAAAR